MSGLRSSELTSGSRILLPGRNGVPFWSWGRRNYGLSPIRQGGANCQPAKVRVRGRRHLYLGHMVGSGKIAVPR